MKSNAKRINNQSFSSILKLMVKLTHNGKIKVANKQCIGINGVSVNDSNYKSKPLGA